MIVRKATPNDMPELIGLAERFYAASGYAVIAEFDSTTVSQVFTNLMDAPDRILLVAEDGPLVGMLGAFVQPCMFNSAVPVCQEMFWWVDTSCRDNGVGTALIEALESYAAENGVGAVFMASLRRHEAVRRLYEQRGYEPSEQTYFKALH